MPGTGNAIIVKLRSAGLIYLLVISADAPLNSADNFCCSALRLHVVLFGFGVNGVSPKTSMTAGPA